MKISSAQFTQYLYTDNFSGKESTSTIDSPSGGASQPDTVQMFEEAMKASSESQHITGQSGDSTRMSCNDLPVEAFSLPKWSNKWIPDLLILDSKIGMKYTDSKAYKYSLLSSDRKEELHEYFSTLMNCINEELENHGIEDRIDYYTKFMQDDALSEEVHQAVKNRLADNPRMMELMESFDISL